MIKAKNSIQGRVNISQKIEGKLNASIVKEYPELEDIEITPSANEQNYTGAYRNVKVNRVETEDLNIVPSTEDQSFNGLYGKVNVQGIEAEEITIIPSTEEQVKEGLFNKVIVNPVTNESSGTDEWEEMLKSCIDKTYGSKVTKLPDGITDIGNYAFNYCSNLALTELPESIISIGNNAFSRCSKLALKKLPKNLTSFGDYAFSYCTALAIDEIPAGITKLNMYAFGYCKNITSLTILGDITEFKGQVFYQASKLEKVVLPNITTVPVFGNNVFDNTQIAYGKGYIYVPDSLVDSIKKATNWIAYASQIKPISELAE